MTVETLENNVKKLREENAYLLEEIKSMRVEQHNILRRLEAVEKNSRPNQPKHQFSFEHESTPRLRRDRNKSWSDEEQFLSDEDGDGDAYSTMNCSSMNSYHEQNSYYTPSTFPPAYHTPHHANSPYPNPLYTSHGLHLTPPSFPYNMPHTNSTPSELRHTPHHQFQLSPPLQHQSDSDAKCNPIKPKKNTNILSSTSIRETR